jgi:hypothetical protein
MEDLQVGAKVHYVQPNGAHSEATVTYVHSQDVVNLHIIRDDTIKSTYNAATVAYRAEPVAYSWHWPEA